MKFPRMTEAEVAAWLASLPKQPRGRPLRNALRRCLLPAKPRLPKKRGVKPDPERGLFLVRLLATADRWRATTGGTYKQFAQTWASEIGQRYGKNRYSPMVKSEAQHIRDLLAEANGAAGKFRGKIKPK